MNATKFAVLLVIGVLCAIVTARPLEEVSKDTKLGISSTNKAATNGIGAISGGQPVIPTDEEEDGAAKVVGGSINVNIGPITDAGAGVLDIDFCLGCTTASDPNPAANSTSSSFLQGDDARQDSAAAGGSGFGGSN